MFCIYCFGAMFCSTCKCCVLFCCNFYHIFIEKKDILYVTGSWKTYLVGTKVNFGKMQLKLLISFSLANFIAYLDKATIKLSCCEVLDSKVHSARRYGCLHPTI